jgi:enoyl-CoA hydratase
MIGRFANALTGPRGRWVRIAVWLAIGVGGFLGRAHIDNVTAGQASFLPKNAESTRALDVLERTQKRAKMCRWSSYSSATVADQGRPVRGQPLPPRPRRKWPLVLHDRLPLDGRGARTPACWTETILGRQMAEPLTYELDGPLATIVMDDGKVNALSIAMLEALHAALDRAEADGAVVILTGRERYFSAGFDLKVFSDEPQRLVEMLTLGATLCERLLSFPTPVLAACSGHAIAAGSFLTLSADLRIGVAGPFKLGLNEVRIGLTVPLFVIELARQRLRPADFNRALVTAAMYDPHQAVSAGFLDRVVPPDELRAASLAAAEELAGLNLEAHRATKLRVRASALKAIRAGIEQELTAAGPGGESTR